MKKAKQEKLSDVDFNKKYFNNPDACEDFFFPAKYPNGFYCEKCECQHQEYLFAGTIFQDNILDLYVLLYDLFLFFNSTKAISDSAEEYLK